MSVTYLEPFGVNTSANYTFANLLVSANITNNGNVNFIGASNVSLGSNANVHITGGSSGGVLTTDGSGGLTWSTQVANALISGTVYTNSQPNITSVGSLSSLTVTGRITATGTGLKAANIEDSSGTITITTKYNNVSGDVGIYGNINVGTSGTGYFIGDGSKLTNLPSANVSGQVSNALVAGTVYTNAQPNITSVGTLTTLTSGTHTLNANANVSMSGTLSQITGANLLSGTYLTGTLTTAAQPNITSVGSLSSLTITGTTTSGNFATAGNITASFLVSNVATGTAPLTVSSTTKVTNLNADTVDGYDTATAATINTIVIRDGNGNITGNVLSATDATISGNATITGNLTVNGTTIYANVTTLNVKDPIIEMGGNPNGTPLSSNDGKDRGTLLHYYTTSPVDAYMGWDNSNGEFAFGSNVSVSSEVVTFNSFGNVRANYFIGNVSLGTGTIANANYSTYAGTVITAAQPNITSVGTLSSLTVSANISSGNANLGNLATASYFTGTLTTGAQPNITSVGTLTTLTSGTHTLNANANVTMSGTLSQITGANLLSGTYLTGTITTAAQPNITSVGTLTTLTSGTHTLNANANVSMSGTLSQISGANLISGTYLTGTLTTAAQPNITSLGTITDLTVSNNISTKYLTVSSISQETFSTITGATGIVTHNVSNGATFYHTSPSANFTPNFTNVTVTANTTTVISLIIIQGVTPYMPTATANIQIAGANNTINWLGGSSPTGTASKTDVVSFSLIRGASTWTVLGQSASFG